MEKVDSKTPCMVQFGIPLCLAQAIRQADGNFIPMPAQEELRMPNAEGIPTPVQREIIVGVVQPIFIESRSEYWIVFRLPLPDGSEMRMEVQRSNIACITTIRMPPSPSGQSLITGR